MYRGYSDIHCSFNVKGLWSPSIFSGFIIIEKLVKLIKSCLSLHTENVTLTLIPNLNNLMFVFLFL